MHYQDCDSCGEYALCDKEGICTDCRYEESLDEQEREEETQEAEEDEGETQNPSGSSGSKT